MVILCEEEEWVDGDDDNFGQYKTCGGEYIKIGNTNLYQCNKCKKVIEK